MGRLYDNILQLKQEVSQIASNETLAAFDGEFCKILDNCSDPPDFGNFSEIALLLKNQH